jgi:DUF4097 and DUF4098 domain-containing protein YvlB
MQRALLMALIGLFILALAAPYAAADTTRTLRVDFSPSPGQRFGVENLAGVMTVVAGSGDRVVATATVHAGSEALAGMMRFERVRGEKGEPVLRVIYPVDEHRRYRYPGGGTSGSSWFGLFGGSNSSTRYDGRKVKVTSSGGVELYADVEVRMPAGEYAAWFRNVVGDLSARGVQGDLEFDTSSGKIDLEELRGIISADTGSGEIEAREMEGSFSGDTGSGSVYLIGFEGESLSCDTGSGSISMEDIRTDRLDADTGSGSISVRGGSARIVKADTGSGRITVVADDVVEFLADTGSGSVRLETDGVSLERVDVDTGSGDAFLRMGAGATFHAMADQGSGTIRNRYDDARPIIRDREVVGYRRGDERIRIFFDTGSGSLILEPGR